MTITHGDDGLPLPDTADVVLKHIPIEEDDEDLVVENPLRDYFPHDKQYIWPKPAVRWPRGARTGTST